MCLIEVVRHAHATVNLPVRNNNYNITAWWDLYLVNAFGWN